MWFGKHFKSPKILTGSAAFITECDKILYSNFSLLCTITTKMNSSNILLFNNLKRHFARYRCKACLRRTYFL